MRQHGRSASSGCLRVRWLDDAPGTAVGYAVGRSVGTAVMRNKVRRRLRAIVSAHPLELPSGALLVAPRPPAVTASYADLERDLLLALRQFEDRS